MNKVKICKALAEAWTLAEDYNEGSIVIQLYPTNRSLIITHQIGNSWESMGLNAHDSQNRIVQSFDCREFEPQYEYGEEKTKEHRLEPEEQDTDEFLQMVDNIEQKVEEVIAK